MTITAQLTAVDDECCTDGSATVTIHPRYGQASCNVTVHYRWLGRTDGPVVIVQGGTSSGRQCASLPSESIRGWWSGCIGPGKAIDTRKVRVLGLDWLTLADLPGLAAISSEDQAQAVYGVLAHHGITQAHAHIGASYGGMVGLALAARYPDLLQRLVVISAADRPHPMTTALRIIQRRIVALADGNPQLRSRALAVARGLAVTTYRSEAEFAQRFAAPPEHGDNGPRFAVEDYLDVVGERFVAAISPERFCALSTSIDLHYVDPTVISVPTTLIGVSSDRLVPIADMRRLAHAISAPTVFYQLDGLYGHDTFLKEPARIGNLVRGALEQPTRSTR